MNLGWMGYIYTVSNDSGCKSNSRETFQNKYVDDWIITANEKPGQSAINLETTFLEGVVSVLDL